MKIERTFTKRETPKSTWSGDVGKVKFEAPDGEYKLDGKTLPAASVEHLLTFALQTLQDAYAGAEDLAEAKANWAKKRDKLVSGEIGTRGTGSGLGEVERECVAILRPYVKGKIKGYGDMTPADRDKAVWAIFPKLADEQQEGIRAKAEAAIAERKADAERMAALVGDLELDDE